MSKFKIPTAPKERIPNVQSTREKKIRQWIQLFTKLLPYGEISRGLTTEDGYIRDNQEEYENAILIYRLEANLTYHSMAYIMLYCCFNNDGTFTISYDGNYESYELYDVSADSIYNHRDDSAGSWKEGYQLIIQIIEEAFGGSNEKLFNTPNGKFTFGN